MISFSGPLSPQRTHLLRKAGGDTADLLELDNELLEAAAQGHLDAAGLLRHSLHGFHLDVEVMGKGLVMAQLRLLYVVAADLVGKRVTVVGTKRSDLNGQVGITQRTGLKKNTK